MVPTAIVVPIARQSIRNALRNGPPCGLCASALRLFNSARHTRPKPSFAAATSSHTRRLALEVQSRSYASGINDGSTGSWLVTGAIGAGVLATIYGLLEYFYKSQTWPEPIRGYLKSGIKARNRGDYETAEAFFRQAIDAALLISPSALCPSPLLKLSGLYITLAAMYESQPTPQPLKAYNILVEAYSHFGDEPLRPGARLPPTAWVNRAPASSSPSGDGNQSGSTGSEYVLDEADHIRAVGLAQKLGHLAVQLGTMRSPPPLPHDTDTSSVIGIDGGIPSGGIVAKSQTAKLWDRIAEHHLSAALTAMLKLGLTASPSPDKRGETGGQVVLGRDLHLPADADADAVGAGQGGGGGAGGDADLGIGRVDRRGVGMTMEALSEVYARQGKYDLANQLLLQTISILLPVRSKVVPPLQDQCQAALLMTTLSSHLSRPQTPTSTRIARSWSLKALQTADTALRSASSSSAEGYTPADLDRDDGAAGGGIQVCMMARSVGSYNLGMLAELEKDNEGAMAHFRDSAESARRIGFRQGQRESIEALRRVSSTSAI